MAVAFEDIKYITITVYLDDVQLFSSHLEEHFRDFKKFLESVEKQMSKPSKGSFVWFFFCSQIFFMKAECITILVKLGRFMKFSVLTEDLQAALLFSNVSSLQTLWVAASFKQQSHKDRLLICREAQNNANPKVALTMAFSGKIDPSKELTLDTDACGWSFGAVLLQSVRRSGKLPSKAKLL